MSTRSTHYASPTSGEAYRDRRLTTNFEFWVEIFCVPTCFHVRIPKPCLSVRPSVRTPRKDIIIASSISVLHWWLMHQWKGLHEYYTMETRKFEFFSKKFEIRILTFDEELKSPYLRQYQSYISNWYINGKVFTSTTQWKPRNLIFSFKKVWNSNFDFWRRAEITLASSISVLH